MSLFPLLKRAVSARPVPRVLNTIEWWINREAIPLMRELRDNVNAHVSPISPVKFGADPTGVRLSTEAIQAALDVAANGVGSVIFPPGTYRTGRLNVPVGQHGTHIDGARTLQTILQFEPTAADLDADGRAPCVTFNGGTAVLSSCSISNLTFASTDTTYQKVMVDARDVSEFRAEHLRGTQWAGNSSMGLLTRGREFIYVQDCTFSCPRVVTIASNPNNSQDCSDQVSFINCYFTGTSATDNLFTIDDGITVGPTTLLNVHMNGGLNGFYWNDTSSTARSNTIRFIGCRYEQTQGFATGGWGIYLHKAGGQGGNFHLEDWAGGNADDYNGVHVIGFGTTMTNCEFQGTGGVYGLDVNGGHFRACHFNLNGALINYNSARKPLAVPLGNGAQPRDMVLEDPALPATSRLITVYDQNLSTALSGNPNDNIVRRTVARFTITVVAPGIIAAAAAYNNSYAAAGVAVGDSIVYGYSGNLVSNGVFVQAQVSNADTVTISIVNMSGAGVNLLTNITVYIDLLGF